MENMVGPRDFTSELAENSEVFFFNVCQNKEKRLKGDSEGICPHEAARGFLELGSFPHNQLTSFIYILPLLAYT